MAECADLVVGLDAFIAPNNLLREQEAIKVRR